MGHYDECREGYCGECGQAEGYCVHTQNQERESVAEEGRDYIFTVFDAEGGLAYVKCDKPIPQKDMESILTHSLINAALQWNGAQELLEAVIRRVSKVLEEAVKEEMEATQANPEALPEVDTRRSIDDATHEDWESASRSMRAKLANETANKAQRIEAEKLPEAD